MGGYLAPGVRFENTQRFVEEVLSEDWHGKRVYALASATWGGVISRVSLMVHAIRQSLAHSCVFW